MAELLGTLKKSPSCLDRALKKIRTFQAWSQALNACVMRTPDERPARCSPTARPYEWLFLWRHAIVYTFHGGGPRVKHRIERPITDVVVTENLIGSLT